VEACRGLGADLAVDYKTDDFVDAVRDFTGGGGVDVVLDVIGGDYINRNIRCVATDGRIIQVGVMDSGTAEVNVGALLPKRASLIGTPRCGADRWSRRSPLPADSAAEMLPLFDSGRLRPIIDSRFAFDDIAAAHRHMHANANVGKILVTVT